jgi:serine/threonine-protein kinase RsbW
VADVRALIRAVAEAPDDDGPEATCRDDLVQAVDEAVTNSIRHGYAGQPGWVDVAIRRDGDRFVVVVEDEAPVFDPGSVSRPDLEVAPERRRPGGMGVHLMRAAMDTIDHRPRPGGGNILTMTRRIVRDS